MQTARQTYSPDPDLAALLARIADGDRAALGTLYEATSMKLYGIALRILRTKDRAEDAMQDIYVKIWDRAGQFDASRGQPLSWLGQVARNHALDEVRRTAIRAADPLDDAVLQLANPHAGLSADGAALTQSLARCMGMLETDRRDMLRLAYQYGLSREELPRATITRSPRSRPGCAASLAALKDCMST